MSPNANSDSRPDSPAAGATTPLGSPSVPAGTARPAGDLAEHHVAGQGAGPPQPLHAWTHVLDAITPARIRRGIAAAGLVAVTVSALAYGLYWWQFSGQGCCDQAAWGQFGDFVGGVINPVVGLLTLIGLAVTVMLQVGQLALSRQALHEAQQEVRAAATERAATAGLLMEQLQSARVTAEAQLRAAAHLHQSAQIAGLSEGIRLAQHRLANMGAIPGWDQDLANESTHLRDLEARARVGFWNLFEKVVHDARSEEERALD